MDTYLVGGAVRDALLGCEPVERDWVVVGASPADLEAAGYRQVGKDFPVFLHPETGEEYALARTERKAGHGYHGFQVHAGSEVTLEEDLGRRDLTINAMAQDTDGQLIDPWGGQADLAARRLRHVSPAFAEDPLRVLRVARFAARLAPFGFTVAPETLALMRTMSASGELDWLVPERVWQETTRALADAAPRRFFDTLVECGALRIVLPELDPLFGPGTDDTGARALTCATDRTTAPDLRMAALCHPLPPEGELSALAQRLPVPRRWQELLRATARWHMNCFELDDTAESAWAVINGLDALRRPERLDAVLVACDAIAEARGETGWPERRARIQAAQAAATAITGAGPAADGWRGEALGRELERRRIEAIRKRLADPDPGPRG